MHRWFYKIRMKKYTNTIAADRRQEDVMTTSASKSLPDEQTEDKDRIVKDRRQKHNEGYTYISIVGWICRREKKRRNTDLQEVEHYEDQRVEKRMERYSYADERMDEPTCHLQRE